MPERVADQCHAAQDQEAAENSTENSEERTAKQGVDYGGRAEAEELGNLLEQRSLLNLGNPRSKKQVRNQDNCCCEKTIS